MILISLFLQTVVGVTSLADLFGASYIESVENQVQSYTETNQVYGDVVNAMELGKVPSNFDYIIAGGGTAGLALANRLSASPNITVAVVETGGLYEEEDPIMRTVPGFCGRYTGWDPSASLGKVPVDWNYVTTPQSALNNQTMYYPRGKCLGGSSSRNYMVYHRPTKGTCSRFANLTNNQDFEFHNWNYYFHRSSSLPPPNDTRIANATPEYTPSLFSPDGPVRLSFPNFAQSWSTWISVGLQKLGIKTSPSALCGGDLLGSAFIPTAIDPSSQQRTTSESSYLRQAIGRENLFVFYNTTFQKVIFDSQKRVKGVNLYTQDGRNTSFNVNKEVVLSGGAFNTPQMLMLSGIGPAGHLNDKGVETVVDSPNVGKNLMDHCMFGPSWSLNFVTTDTKFAKDTQYYQDVIEQYVDNQTGPLTDIPDDLIAFQRLTEEDISADFLTEYSKMFADDWPHIEYLTVANWVGNWGNANFSPNNSSDYASLQAAIVSPLSRGEVSLSSNSIWDKPHVDPKFLSHPADQAVAVASYKLLRKVGKSINNVASYESYPGLQVETDEQILSVIKKVLVLSGMPLVRLVWEHISQMVSPMVMEEFLASKAFELLMQVLFLFLSLDILWELYTH